MPSRINASTTVLFALLCTCTASGYGLKKSHKRFKRSRNNASADAMLTDNYAGLLLDELKSKESGAVLGDSKVTALTDEIEDVFQTNTTADAINVSISSAKHFLAKQFAKLQNDGNSSLVTSLGNQTHVEAGSSQVGVNTTQASVEANKTEAIIAANKTKAIEAAAVSLPMASFALPEATAPAKNKTEPKFPGNATVKAAFEKKEQTLETEIHTLKARLENASDSLAATKKVLPMAAGTFNANLAGKNIKAAEKFVVANGTEPMQPIRNDDKPKASWPTMTSLAAPVDLHHVSAAATPPQKEAIQAQEGEKKKVAMGSAFTGVPAKKTQSILAMDVAVTNDAVAMDDQSSEDALSPSVLGWFSSFFTWLRGTPPVTPVLATPKPAAPEAAVHRKPTAFIWVKQDSAQTAQAVQEEHQRNFEVNDAWDQMEKEDGVKQESIRREDAAERARAEARELPHKLLKSQLKGRHGPEISSFWKQLEKEDHTIEQTVQSDDLVKLAELEQAQDKKVAKANSQLDVNKETTFYSTLKHNKLNSDLRLAIHEPWLRREQRDVKLERQIHASKDLQMLQLRHDHHHN